MDIEILNVTEAEFNLIRPHFEVNAKALASQTHFIGADGELNSQTTQKLVLGGLRSVEVFENYNR